MVAVPVFVVEVGDDVAVMTAVADVDYTGSCEYCLDLLCCTFPFDNDDGCCHDVGLVVFDCQNSADSIGLD